MNASLSCATWRSQSRPRRAILDGEIVALDEQGNAVFRLATVSQRQAMLDSLHAFDLLYLDGFNLTQCPLLARKKALKKNSTEAQHGQGEVYRSHLHIAACRPWGYESITTATEFHHGPHNPVEPERTAPNRMLYVPHALYILHEVWQESGKERTSKLAVRFRPRLRFDSSEKNHTGLFQGILSPVQSYLTHSNTHYQAVFTDVSAVKAGYVWLGTGT